MVTATLRDQNGRPLSGRDVFFSVSDEDGRFADIGFFQGQNGPGTGFTARTSAQGIAQVIYQAPPRTDATANQSLVILARPVGTRLRGGRLPERAPRAAVGGAEALPAEPDERAPTCNFVVEAPNGLRTNVAILFQTTSSDTDGVVVRYEWFFGDGIGGGICPDVAHVYRLPGSFTVTHRVTDDDGGQQACAAGLPITP